MCAVVWTGSAGPRNYNIFGAITRKNLMIEDMPAIGGQMVKDFFIKKMLKNP
jgi:hypothetical protein